MVQIFLKKLIIPDHNSSSARLSNQDIYFGSNSTIRLIIKFLIKISLPRSHDFKNMLVELTKVSFFQIFSDLRVG